VRVLHSVRKLMDAVSILMTSADKTIIPLINLNLEQHFGTIE
jgi:hypothetical protein